jgi:hypothetical protein
MRGDERPSSRDPLTSHVPHTSRPVSDAAIPLLAVAVGLVGVLLGTLLVRSSGANTRTGRRLAGARAAGLGDLHHLAQRNALPTGQVRVHGRVRCANPIVTPDGDQLALLHRDVELQLPGGQWRVVERLREVRPIDLWDRMASVPLDLARLAEPLIAIPEVWEGFPDELDPSHQPAVERIRAEAGPPQRARATTRRVMLVDHLIVLAVPGRAADGSLRLDPPPGGYLATSVELDVAMRLLAGGHRTRMVAGFGVTLAGGVVLVLGALGLLATLAG